MIRLLVLASLLLALPARADEWVLKGITAFRMGTTFSLPFEAWVDRVNERGAGLVRVDLLGGPETMSVFEMGNAVSTGVVDILSSTSAYYTSLVPTADALHLATNTVQEQRANGCLDRIDEIHRQQMNVKYLARTGDHIPFHLYLTKPIDRPDLSGLIIRTTPVYRAMFEALGATLLRTKPGDVYEALERGTIDGYGWPIQGVLDLGWEEQTRYRVDPGFYQVDVNVLVHLDTWNRLDGARRAILEEAARWLEDRNADNIRINATERERQAEAGIRTIEFEGDDSRHWLNTAQEEGWTLVAELDEVVANDLRVCLTD